MSIEHEDALASVDEGCRAHRAAGQRLVDLERRTPSIERRTYKAERRT